MTNLVILISGRGSNMIAIADACRREGWPARIAAVIGHSPDTPGLHEARALGLATDVVDVREFPERAAREEALAVCIDRHGADFVVLAGYMRILSPGFVRRYAGRMVNIHPSLLPSFAGLHTHRRALEAGVTAHGATVHLVTDELDGGPILAQAVVRVRDDDDEDRLAARVLRAEHRLYPMVLRWLVEGRVGRSEGRVRVEGVGAWQRCLVIDEDAAPGDAVAASAGGFARADEPVRRAQQIGQESR